MISSLPMLNFGMKSPFTFGKFLQMCEDLISDEDIALISKTSQHTSTHNIDGITFPTFKKWVVFDATLRNELVKIRAVRKHVDAAKYLCDDGLTDVQAAHIAMAAYRTPSLLEAERYLDEVRWRLLDDLCLGHYFDLDFLLIYALKLLILERWDLIRSADKENILEEVIECH